ncbi:hypothetical protein D0T56_09295 [Dysgonomonas sp. 520]|nr:hypothetical protein [Dysgonomonas sp. 520]
MLFIKKNPSLSAKLDNLLKQSLLQVLFFYALWWGECNVKALYKSKLGISPKSCGVKHKYF